MKKNNKYILGAILAILLLLIASCSGLLKKDSKDVDEKSKETNSESLAEAEEVEVPSYLKDLETAVEEVKVEPAKEVSVKEETKEDGTKVKEIVKSDGEVVVEETKKDGSKEVKTVKTDGKVIVEKKDNKGKVTQTKETKITDSANKDLKKKVETNIKENKDKIVVIVPKPKPKPVVKETQKETTPVVTPKPAETQKETVKETVKETEQEQVKPVETVRETVKETVKETERETQREPKITTSTVTENQSIPFGTTRKHNIAGAKTRVSTQGQNGTKTLTYKLTFTDGVQTNRELISTNVTKNPVNQIIQTYVKVQDRKVETREVDDKTRPIYTGSTKPRWFVSHTDPVTNKKYPMEYYYSKDVAYNRYSELSTKYLVRWGTAQDEFDPNGGDLIGYYPKKVQVVIQEEKWEWQ